MGISGGATVRIPENALGAELESRGYDEGEGHQEQREESGQGWEAVLLVLIQMGACWAWCQCC